MTKNENEKLSRNKTRRVKRKENLSKQLNNLLNKIKTER